jgi:tetratricopeptide (TPR) repeat protein
VADKAKAAVASALELDPTLGEAYSALGTVQWAFDWDFDAAEQSFLRAIELNPNYALAHSWYSVQLATLGRFDEAIEQARIARQLSPLTPVDLVNLAVWHHFSGDDERAVALLEQSIEHFPAYADAYQPLGMILSEHGEFERGIALLEQVHEMDGRLVPLIYAHGLAGNEEEARRLLGELEERAQTGFVSPLDFAVARVSLGEYDEVITLLERAYEFRLPLVLLSGVYPPYAPLRSDPRFIDLMRRMGVPFQPEQTAGLSWPAAAGSG